MVRYDFKENGLYHSVVMAPGANRKLGLYKVMVKTYVFSMEQVLGFERDRANCGTCPLSKYNSTNGKSKCYTHKGVQSLGLKSMLKRLHRLDVQGSLKEFDQRMWDLTLALMHQSEPSFIRFGEYGDPSLLGLSRLNHLTTVLRPDKLKQRSWTGYTQEWRKLPEGFNKLLMASSHSIDDDVEANSAGWRTFRVAPKGTGTPSNSIVCPASKEAGNKTTCAACILCNGTSGNSKKNIVITKH